MHTPHGEKWEKTCEREIIESNTSKPTSEMSALCCRSADYHTIPIAESKVSGLKDTSTEKSRNYRIPWVSVEKETNFAVSNQRNSLSTAVDNAI